VYGGYQVFDCSQGAITFKSSPQSYANPFEALLRKNHIMVGTVMFNVAILRRAGGFDQTCALVKTMSSTFAWPEITRLPRTHILPLNTADISTI
jgi:hypothetical protein